MSIEKRSENTYRLTVSMGYTKEGKKLRKQKTIDLCDTPVKKQMREAQKRYILFENEVKKGMYVDHDKITLKEFIELWMKEYAIPSLELKTLSRYKQLLTRIIPALGNIKLSQLQPTHITSFYNNLRECGVRFNKKYISKENFVETILKLGFTLDTLLVKADISDKTITSLKLHNNVNDTTATKVCKATNLKVTTLFDKAGKDEPLAERTILHHHRLITDILNTAIQWNYILINPATRVKPPKVPKKDARYFDIESVEFILQLLENEPIKYRAAIVLTIFTGLRLGELTALKWEDIDMKNFIINIDKSSLYTPESGMYIKSTKTGMDRLVSIPESVINILKKYKLSQNECKLKLGDLWNKEETYVFTTYNGNAIFPSTPSKWFAKFIKKHNEYVDNDSTIPKEEKSKYLLKNVNFHGLRHTNATILINQNMDIATVSKRLGHSKISTTTDIYTHALQKADRTASDTLDNLFNKKNIQTKEHG